MDTKIRRPGLGVSRILGESSILSFVTPRFYMISKVKRTYILRLFESLVLVLKKEMIIYIL